MYGNQDFQNSMSQYNGRIHNLNYESNKYNMGSHQEGHSSYKSNGKYEGMNLSPTMQQYRGMQEGYREREINHKNHEQANGPKM